MKNIATGFAIIVLVTVFAPVIVLYFIGAGERLNPRTMLPSTIAHALLWVLVARMVGWL